jgi:hypothetical protein
MPRLPKDNPTSRLNLEMSEETRRRLELLRKATNSDSLAEVVRKALKVYDFLWHESAGGNQVVVKGPEGDKQLILM